MEKYKFESGFLNKNDKKAIIENLSNDLKVGEYQTICHHNTMLIIEKMNTEFCAMKSVSHGTNYLYGCYFKSF